MPAPLGNPPSYFGATSVFPPGTKPIPPTKPWTPEQVEALRFARDVYGHMFALLKYEHTEALIRDLMKLRGDASEIIFSPSLMGRANSPADDAACP